MTERPSTPAVTPKNSESDPPAANQPTGDDKASDATPSAAPPADGPQLSAAPEIVPGKPDGEVDTRT